MQICHNHLMEIIGAYLEESDEGTLHYEVVNDEGKV